MQKTTLVAVRLLLFHQTEQSVYVACVQDATCIESIELPHRDTSKLLVPLVAQVLEKCDWTLQDLTAIACTTGPGPFTTLRALVVTANGLGFATHLPLIDLHSLAICVRRIHTSDFTGTCFVAPAYCNDLYVCSYQPGRPIQFVVVPASKLASQIVE